MLAAVEEMGCRGVKSEEPAAAEARTGNGIARTPEGREGAWFASTRVDEALRRHWADRDMNAPSLDSTGNVRGRFTTNEWPHKIATEQIFASASCRWAREKVR